MNSELFEELLYEEENAALDFKKKQYRFAGATEVDKSELLKDILGFANAWRRSEAYILIGVEDVRGARGNVVGIPATDHLDDHSLQQFVNNLTNQPVRFHYEAFGVEGKQVGIISIDEQTRPIYLRRDYGKLAQEKVYVRRGSSTDPTKPALPEEIAQMRVGAGQPAAELIVEFADVKGDDALGPKILLEVEFCEMPPIKAIPDLPHALRRDAFGIGLSAIGCDPLNRPNENFFRELANFEFVRRLFRPIRLVVRNVGQVGANNVRAELTVSANAGMVIDASEFPALPKRRAGLLSNSVLKGIRSAFGHDSGEVRIDKNDERFRVEIDCGDLQPGRRVWSEVFYIGKKTSGELSLCGFVFAENLPKPKKFALAASISVTETRMTVDELCALGELAGRDE